MDWKKLGIVVVSVGVAIYVCSLSWKTIKFTSEDIKLAKVEQTQGTVTKKEHRDSKTESYMSMTMKGQPRMKTRYVSEKNHVYITWKYGDRTLNDKNLFNAVKVGDPVVVTYKVGYHTDKIYYQKTEKGELDESNFAYR